MTGVRIIDRSRDREFMAEALRLATEGQLHGEVPVGAVLVMNGVIVGRGYNSPISCHDPSAHAEMIAIREAAFAMGNYRLPGSTLYVTLEPCAMCAGLLVHARIARLVYGTAEPRAGAVASRSCFLEQPYLNHRVLVEGGLLAEQSAELLQTFFRKNRDR